MANSRKTAGRGYKTSSEKLDEDAKKYAGYERTLSEDALKRKERGEKGYVPSFDRNEVETRVRSAERIYKENASTKEGRELNKRNMQFQESEAAKVRATNSREQYEHEKATGDPNALKLSFEEWKKL
jgi:hypothetical protein